MATGITGTDVTDTPMPAGPQFRNLAEWKYYMVSHRDDVRNGRPIPPPPGVSKAYWEKVGQPGLYAQAAKDGSPNGVYNAIGQAGESAIKGWAALPPQQRQEFTDYEASDNPYEMGSADAHQWEALQGRKSAQATNESEYNDLMGTYGERTSGVLTGQEKLQTELARRQAENDAFSARATLKNELASRGQLGSGGEIGTALGLGQDVAQSNMEANMRAMAQASQRAEAAKTEQAGKVTERGTARQNEAAGISDLENTLAGASHITEQEDELDTE